MKRTSIIWIVSVNIILIILSFIFPVIYNSNITFDDDGEFQNRDTLQNDFLNAIFKNSEFPQNDYKARNYDNHYGMWISYIDLSEMLYNSTEDSFREEISRAYKNLKDLGVNTVYVHVRAFGDAYYPSILYPYADAFGKNDSFDALSIMIDEAHELELSFHAWINPLRCQTDEKISQLSSNYKLKGFYDESYNEMLVSVENSPYMWLNPAYEEVRDYVAQGAAEIVSRYNVDGIHIDDYFYPTITDSFDSEAFEASGATDLSQWRLNNITKLVMGMNVEIKKVNPSVEFDISPQGNINNNYTQMYADVNKWCKSTVICDNIIPQVYFGYESSSPYLSTISKWSEMVGDNENVNLIIGLGAYKISEESEYKYTKNILAKQINDAFKLYNVSGVAFYNYSIFYNNDEYTDKMNSEKESIKEIIKK